MSVDVVQAWIDNVAYSHSQCKGTALQYRKRLEIFCHFAGRTPQQILDDYESMRERDFRRKFATYAKALISKQLRQGYAPNSIKSLIVAVKSFFKYSDLPLGHIPVAKNRITYHNRDITQEEIRRILAVSRPRDRAFFCMMAQTGLRPGTLCGLKLKHIEPEFSEGIIPCKIEVPEEIAKGKYHSYFTFMGEESVKYLKDYLATRPDIGAEDYLFMTHGATKKTTYSTFSVIFCRTIKKLREKRVLNFEQKQEGKPRTVRLYSLRKFFRKYANQAGFEFVQFWMGHTVKEGVDDHYRPKDVEFHRELYAEKAMPFLRLEASTPTETEKTIKELKEQLGHRDKEADELKDRLKALEKEIIEQKRLLKNLVKSSDLSIENMFKVSEYAMKLREQEQRQIDIEIQEKDEEEHARTMRKLKKEWEEEDRRKKKRNVP